MDGVWRRRVTTPVKGAGGRAGWGVGGQSAARRSAVVELQSCENKPAAWTYVITLVTPLHGTGRRLPDPPVGGWVGGGMVGG